MSDGPMFGGHETIALRSGGTLRCGVDGTRGPFVECTHGLLRRERVQLPYPSAGVGGVELVVSPDERWAALFIYSGQSEDGYELFALEPALRHVGGAPYQIGLGLVPIFSPDARWLAMVSTSEYYVRGSDKHVEDVLVPDGGAPDAYGDGDGDVIVDWAKLVVQAIPDGAVETVAIGTRVPRSMDLDEIYEWNLYDKPSTFVSGSRIAIPLPWGPVLEVDLPVRGPITTPPFDGDAD